MPQDWFAQNAPKGNDWFSQNAPSAPVVTAPQPTMPAPSMLSTLLGPTVDAVKNLSDVAIGAGKGIESTVHEGGQMLRNAFPSLNKLPSVSYTRPEPPTNAAQQVGKTGEQLAEYAIPASGVAGATKGAGLLARMGAQAATAGTVSAIQGHTAPEVAATAATAGAVPAISDAVGALAKKAAPLVNRWLQVAPKELDFGGDPGMRLVSEKLVKATKAATEKAIQPALNDAGTQLGTALANATSQGIAIDATNTIDNALTTATKTIGKRSDKAFQAALDNVKADIVKQFPDINSLTPLRAQELKIAIGDGIKWHGAALEGDINEALVEIYRGLNSAIKGVVPDAAALQSRWSDLYVAAKSIKQALRNDTAGAGTGAINPILKRGALAAAGTATTVGTYLGLRK